ncbi:defective in Cullin neddylation protein 1 [Cryptococcus bacillisporus CA1873]|uniref:Defective in cullin neddylation protein n=1 Tax=Cryptococcus bacillisporus CA1873 TaxID=1296111 RepID=A0ABR5B9V9_CRYGA|nr:defective in Cullin neddylation protein 1 [Cryptococcus bacillisporus CA1873]|eukprot:KIR60386.1 defective in Cullin neddylation protein 1 [Cryptococcus gattii CA1873]
MATHTPQPLSTKDSLLVTQFRAITGTSSADAAKYIKKYKYIEAAVDAFYNNEPAPRADPAQERKLGEVWEKFKDPSDPKLIKIDGTMELCEELDIDPGTDAVLFCLAADLGSKATGEWEKAPFVAGIASYPGNIDSLSKLKAYLPNLREKLVSDPEYFKKVYNHAFQLARGGPQSLTRSLPLDTAIDLWTLFFPPAFNHSPSALSHLPDNTSPQFTQPEFDLWIEFMQQKNKAVSKDTWALLVDFARSIDKDFKEYDEDGAWPSMIDDFVEYVREIKGGQ